MQQFYQKIILDHSICQTALIFTALTNWMIKIHPNWKIALILVACCQYPCGYVTNLNMANCCVYCLDSYPTLRFVTYPQGKKWADMGSYTTECHVKRISRFWKFQHIFQDLMYKILAGYVKDWNTNCKSDKVGPPEKIFVDCIFDLSSKIVW